MERALDLMRTGVRQSAPVRYGATVGLVTMSTLARLGLDPLMSLRPPRQANLTMPFHQIAETPGPAAR